MLHECKSQNREVMMHHPALLTQQERLQLIINIGNIFKSQRVDFDALDPSEDPYQPWESYLQSVTGFNEMQTCLQMWLNTNGWINFPPHIRYVFFIRNCSQHIQHQGFTSNTSYALRRLGKDFDDIDPKLASFLFESFFLPCDLSHYEFGYGQLWLAKYEDFQLPVRLENIREELLNRYFHNMKTIGTNPYILGCKGFCVQNSSVIKEVYTHTMSELLLAADVNIWWETVQSRENKMWRMSSEFQQLFKQIISGVETLMNHEISFEITLDSVVFYYEDFIMKGMESLEKAGSLKNGSLPKLRNIWDAEGSFNYKSLGNGLANIIKDVIDYSTPKIAGFSVHSEVEELMKMFRNNFEWLNFFVFKDHPALLTGNNRLNLMVKMRYLFYEFKGFYLNSTYNGIVNHWKDEVQNNEQFNAISSFRNNRNRYENDYSGLIHFIRDCVQHLNDGTNVAEFGRLSTEELDLQFDKKFPGFYSWVFFNYAVSSFIYTYYQFKCDRKRWHIISHLLLDVFT